MMRAAAALAALFVLLALGGAEGRALLTLGKVTLLAIGIGVVWDVADLTLRRGSPRPPRRHGSDRSTGGRRRTGQRRRKGSAKGAKGRARPRDQHPPPTILIDGSNVMHWNANAPSAMVLTRVVQALTDKGERPHVYFDANAGYKLADRFMDAQALADMIGVSAAQITVADSGMPADPLLLDHADRSRLRIVTNDRFLDWKAQFPAVGSRDFLVKGRWQEGTPILRL